MPYALCRLIGWKFTVVFVFEHYLLFIYCLDLSVSSINFDFGLNRLKHRPGWC